MKTGPAHKSRHWRWDSPQWVECHAPGLAPAYLWNEKLLPLPLLFCEQWRRTRLFMGPNQRANRAESTAPIRPYGVISTLFMRVLKVNRFLQRRSGVANSGAAVGRTGGGPGGRARGGVLPAAQDRQGAGGGGITRDGCPVSRSGKTGPICRRVPAQADAGNLAPSPPRSPNHPCAAGPSQGALPNGSPRHHAANGTRSATPASLPGGGADHASGPRQTRRRGPHRFRGMPGRRPLGLWCPRRASENRAPRRHIASRRPRPPSS